MEVNLIANENSKSPVSEAYRNIRTNLAFSNAAGAKLVKIMMTSATPNEGKSTTIANLAVVLAQSGKKVVLVDCDLRNPTQHKTFKVKNIGMSNAIIGKEINEVIIQTEIDNLWLIPGGPVAPNPSELLGSQRMQQILEQLAEEFDYVLVDAPPIMPVTDAAVISGIVDGVILLVASGAISPQVAMEAKRRLEQGGAHLLGVVLNKVDVTSHHSSYGGGYYYYYGDDGKKEKRETK